MGVSKRVHQRVRLCICLCVFAYVHVCTCIQENEWQRHVERMYMTVLAMLLNLLFVWPANSAA